MKIPQKIKVGFQNRNDTYTGKLGYVIVNDGKKWQCETSWESWRSKEIEPQEFDNVPTEGFVLNKKVGGYKSDWNYRQAYIRIYDPRGFEFEITVANLLNILEYSNSVVGKGLEGKFIYVKRDGKLWLQTINDIDFKNILNQGPIKPISRKEFSIGKIYYNEKNEPLTYYGFYNIHKKVKRLYSLRGSEELTTKGIIAIANRMSDSFFEMKHSKNHIFISSGEELDFFRIPFDIQTNPKVVRTENEVDINYAYNVQILENSALVSDLETFELVENSGVRPHWFSNYINSYKKISDYEYIEKTLYYGYRDIYAFVKLEIKDNTVIATRIHNYPTSIGFITGNLYALKTNKSKILI